MSIGAVTRGACRDAGVGGAALKDKLADRRQIVVPGLTRSGLPTLSESGESCDIFVLQALDHIGQGLALAAAIAKVPQLLLQVVRMLRGQARIDGTRALSLGAVAQRTARGDDFRDTLRYGGRRRRGRLRRYDEGERRQRRNDK